MLGAAQMMEDPKDVINSCDMVWLGDQVRGACVVDDGAGIRIRVLLQCTTVLRAATIVVDMRSYSDCVGTRTC